MKRDIYILHAQGLLGVTKVVFDDNTPGDIILTVSGSQVDQAEQMFIEETNIDPLDITTVQATRQYKTVSIPIQKIHAQPQQTVEAMSRDW
jgi:hypothetical protein